MTVTLYTSLSSLSFGLSIPIFHFPHCSGLCGDFLLQFTKEADFSRMLEIEEEYVRRVCNDIIAFKPDLVFTEKGVSGESFFSTYSSIFPLFLSSFSSYTLYTHPCYTHLF